MYSYLNIVDHFGHYSKKLTVC